MRKAPVSARKAPVSARKIPIWPIAGVVLFVAISLVATIYLALALALCVLVMMGVYWVATELPKRVGGGGPDR